MHRADVEQNLKEIDEDEAFATKVLNESKKLLERILGKPDTTKCEAGPAFKPVRTPLTGDLRGFTPVKRRNKAKKAASPREVLLGMKPDEALPTNNPFSPIEENVEEPHFWDETVEEEEKKSGPEPPTVRHLP